MQNDDWKKVYDTLYGVAEQKAEGVENAFGIGTFCETRYCQMLAAYERLHRLLAQLGEDGDDLEIILNTQRDIEMELCRKMFQYGARRK